jgi:DEAD/DEAH box helicase domain-containing protein
MHIMKKIVFDCETSNIFTDVGSCDAKDLDLSVVCIYDYETDKYSSFTKETLKDLWPIFEKADLLIGYNSDHFDIPLLNKYYSGDLSKIQSLDLLKEIKNSLGRRIKLDSVAEATLGKNKSGHGLEATVWWKNGEYQKVIDYCIDDVKITKEVYEYALKNGNVKYKDIKDIKEIKLNTSNWEEKKEKTITHTLFG